MDIGDTVVVIARLSSAEIREIAIQDFMADGKPFIPIFSDEVRFKAETAGSGFEEQGVVIDRSLLASLLRGDETLVLNPGSTKRTLSKADLDHR